MIFVAVHYWPYLLAALLAGLCVGWWSQAAMARRARAGSADEIPPSGEVVPGTEGWE